MAGTVAQIGAVGSLLGGAQGMLLALALAMNAGALLFADHAVLRLYRAQNVHPATAPRMTVNPLSAGGVAGLFGTHPSTRWRIARLLAMAH